MKNIFLTLLCGILFQLRGMEIKNTINLNDPNNVLTPHIMLPVSPDFSDVSFDNTEQKAYYSESYNTLIKDIEHSQEEWSIISLLYRLKLYKYGEKPFPYANVTFKKENKEESMLVEFNSYVLCTDMCTIEPGQLYMIFTFQGTHLPFGVENKQLIAEQNTEIPDSIKKLMTLLETYSENKSYTQKEIVKLPVNEREVAINYDVEEEKTIPVKDAILLCRLLQPFNEASIIDSKL